MAEEGGGKMKERRTTEHGKPYDRRQSIMGRVTDSVKDMLAPSWLMDLVSSVKKKSPTQTLEQTHACVTEQTGSFPIKMNMPQTPSVSNPAVQISHHTPGPLDSSFSGAMRTPQFHQGMTSTPAQPPAFTSHHLPFSFMDRPNTSSLIVNGADDQSEMSEFSMSTANISVTPHPDRKHYQHDVLTMSESHIAQLRQDLGGSVTPSRELEAKSSECMSQDSDRSFLWSSDIKQSQSSQRQGSSRPSFNLSAFQVPGKVQEQSSVFGTDYQLSPYYPGRTTFGGAAAHNQVKFKHTTPYQLTPSRRQVKAQPLNNSLGGITSSTAKRILDTLDRMSTPVNDAKKIPSLNSSLIDSPLSFTPRSYPRSGRRYSMPGHRHESLQGPPVHGLNTPTMASIARNVHRPSAAALNSQRNNIESQITQQPQRSLRQSVVPSQPNSRGMDSISNSTSRSGKMRREKGQHYSTKHLDEEEEVEMPDLPTDFVLPLASMPAFNFGSGLTSTASHNNKQRAQFSTTDFRFSSPIAADRCGSAEPSVYSQTLSSPQKFHFSSPIAVDAAVSSTHVYSREPIRVTSVPSLATPQYIKRPELETHNEPEVEMPPTIEPVLIVDNPASHKRNAPEISVEQSFGLKPSEELKQGSVMDILGKMSPLPSQLCKDTMVKSTTADTNKPEKINSAVQHTSSSVVDVLAKEAGSKRPVEDKPSLASMFQKPKGSWECPTCMINNKESSSKCVACETAKPGPPPVPSTLIQVAIPADQSRLSSLFKRPEGSWDCPTCMIQNGPSISKCPACETAKPQATATRPVKSVVSLPTTGPSLSQIFKAPVGSWECPTCMIQSKADVETCPACETKKPGGATKPNLLTTKQDTLCIPKPTGPGFGDLFKRPIGSWECDTCMVNNKAEATHCIACETPKPGFKPTTSFTSPGGFKFGGSMQIGSKDTSDSTSSLKAPENASTDSYGFQFGGSSSSAAKTEEEISKAPKGPGFQFKLASTDSKTPFGGIFSQRTGSQQSNSESVTKPIQAPPVGGFSFPADSAPKMDGGFHIPTSDTSEDSKTTMKKAVNCELADNKSPDLGGFNFGLPPSSLASTPTDVTTLNKPVLVESSGIFGSTSTVPSSVSLSTIGGFNMRRTSSITSTSDSVTPVVSSVESKEAPPAGLFLFGQKPQLKVESTATTSTSSSLPFTLSASSASSTLNPTGLATSEFSFKPSATAANVAPPTGQFVFSAQAAATKPLGTTFSKRLATVGDETDLSSAKKGRSITSGTPGFNFLSTTPNSLASLAVPSQTSVSSTGFSTVSPKNAAFGGSSTAAVFGGPAQSVPAPGFGSSGTLNSTTFTPTFGTTASKTPAFAPAFGSATTTAAATFGTSSVFGTTAQTTTTTASSAFNFGNSSQGLFQFGANASQSAAAPAQPQNPPNMPSFTPNPSTFNFSAGQTGASGTSAPYTFNASQNSSAASNPFSVAASPSANTKRPVKRAVRKLRK